METTHWADLAENFKLQDVACLMAGVPPAKEMVAWSDKLPPEARYVFERLWKAYMQGACVHKQPELDSADFQKMLHGIDATDFRAPTIVPARGMIRRQNMLIAPSAELKRKRLESVRVSRQELHRWVKAMGIKSAYSFAPVATSHSAVPDTAPAQKPAPAETKAQRQDRRLNACENAGLNFKDYKGRLPDGVGKVADTEGVKRQPFSVDVKAALKRRESANREGVIVRRA